MFLCSITLLSALFSGCAPVPPFAAGYAEGEYVLIAPVTTARIEQLLVARGDTHELRGAARGGVSRADVEA